MDEVTTIDLAKNVFQVHGVDAAGATVICWQLKRSQVLPFFGKLRPCLVGAEAGATAHHWAREIGALGHEVRLMPAVKAYVRDDELAMAALTGQTHGGTLCVQPKFTLANREPVAGGRRVAPRADPGGRC